MSDSAEVTLPSGRKVTLNFYSIQPSGAYSVRVTPFSPKDKWSMQDVAAIEAAAIEMARGDARFADGSLRVTFVEDFIFVRRTLGDS
jgi:hypothetical protein